MKVRMGKKDSEIQSFDGQISMYEAPRLAVNLWSVSVLGSHAT